ncbi:hypothetical protein HMN09_00921500 [Mycena chlorophos]|uniref:F-box domain-containing protein n=1 Tax=Mycena chlorophos TaxID=658473 RepID=A0A8H6SK80_MYCCL|nr:hypothetical protein HMN09_00921500 [Mycena chlorophos]
MSTQKLPDGFFSSNMLPRDEQLDAVLDLLRDGDIASAPPDLRSVAVSAERDVDRYEAEIDRLESALDRLYAERGRLRFYGDTCASVFSPIHRLPTELLVEILSLAEPDVPLPERKNRRNAALDTLGNARWCVLATVCKRWQDVVMGTPSIWSKITLRGDLSNSMSWAEKLVRRALQRSAVSPLQIVIAMDHSDFDWSLVGLRPEPRLALSLLAAESERWQSFSFAGTSSELEQLSDGIHHRLQLLEKVAIRYSGPEDSEAYAQFTDYCRSCPLFEDTPLLRSFEFEAPVPLIPWGQLQRVRCNGVYDSLAFLARCPPACEVTVSGVDPAQVTTVVQSAHVAILHLGLLREDDDSREFGHLLTRLQLPHLRSLMLYDASEITRNHIHLWSWDPAAFAAFISTSTRLSVLSLRDIQIAPVELLSALAQTPLLESLTVEDVLLNKWDMSHSTAYHFAWTDDVLRALMIGSDGSGPALVPRLSEVAMISYVSFDVEILEEFLRSRTANNTASAFTLELTAMAMTNESNSFLAESGKMVDGLRSKLQGMEGLDFRPCVWDSDMWIESQNRALY